MCVCVCVCIYVCVQRETESKNERGSGRERARKRERNRETFWVRVAPYLELSSSRLSSLWSRHLSARLSSKLGLTRMCRERKRERE